LLRKQRKTLGGYFLPHPVHTTCVAQTVAGHEHNKVLNTTAPEVDASEFELPRKTRTFLVQLRSGSDCFFF